MLVLPSPVLVPSVSVSPPLDVESVVELVSSPVAGPPYSADVVTLVGSLVLPSLVLPLVGSDVGSVVGDPLLPLLAFVSLVSSSAGQPASASPISTAPAVRPSTRPPLRTVAPQCGHEASATRT